MTTSPTPFQTPRAPDALATPIKDPWSPTAIGLISFFCSFLPAGIMYALNFERLGQPEKKNTALAVVLIGFAAFVALIVVTPDNSPFSRIFTFINIGVAVGLHRTQKDAFEAHISRGGKKAPVLVPVLLSLALVIVAAGGVIAWAYVAGAEDEANFARAVELMNQEKYAEAEPIFTSYKESYPEEPATYWNLAQIYLRTGRLREAKVEADKLMEVDPKHENGRELVESIADALRAEQ